MTNKEFLAVAKVGSIINNKRILAALKKRGLIFGYSEWGYLESCKVRYKDEWDGKPTTEREYIEVFPKGNARECESSLFESREKMWGFIGNGKITYMGCELSTKYLDGCFQPYLQLVAKNGSREKEVNPRMSLWGQVI